MISTTFSDRQTFLQADAEVEPCSLPQGDMAALHLEPEIGDQLDISLPAERQAFQEVCPLVQK